MRQSNRLMRTLWAHRQSCLLCCKRLSGSTIEGKNVPFLEGDFRTIVTIVTVVAERVCSMLLQLVKGLDL